jgi:hypothetical protein
MHALAVNDDCEIYHARCRSDHYKLIFTYIIRLCSFKYETSPMIQIDASGDRPAAFGSLRSLRILGRVDPPLCNFMTNSGSSGPPGPPYLLVR